MEYHLRVILNEDAQILEYEDPQNLLGYGVHGEDVVGKNWFSEFIDVTDFKEVMDKFVKVFSGALLDSNSLQNDVLAKDRSHKFIDFYNRFITYQGETCLESFGFEHYTDAVHDFNPSAFPR
ncbi:MAG: hypothetical protein JXK16_10165 [Thiotrichales bacterium]|nr:hypothetical protein [Thiotrichales bacterium]